MDNLIFNAMPEPVLFINSERILVRTNSAAVDLFDAVFLGQDLSLTIQHADIIALVDKTLRGEIVDKVDVDFPDPVLRTYQVSATCIDVPAKGKKQSLVMFHDITAIRTAEKFRSDFIANLSHELRSPLVSLIGFLETLEDLGEDDPKTRDRFYGIMNAESHRMKALIDDLLVLSKIEANEHIPPKDSVNLPDILETVITPLQQKARNKGMTFDTQIDERCPIIPGDRQELVQIFTNLTNNALNYSAENSSIQITLTALEVIPNTGKPGVCVAVSNIGDVIAPKHLPRLTERFYRIDKGRSRSVGGTGLGLAIVKHLVNHHRGSLVITSNEINGTTFSVFLPS
ncbi:MAG: ATP-binding protein [Sneathiella sp.]